MPSTTYILSASLALGAVLAMPTLTPREAAAIKRDVQASFAGLPGCSADPTYASGTSAFNDGDGVYIGSDCDNQDYDWSEHCWTDYYLVGTTEGYQNWTLAVGDIDCSTTNTCSQTIGASSQYCTAFEWSISEQISSTFTTLFGTIGVSVTATQSTTQQSCATTTDQSTCSYNDSACHSVWESSLVKTVHGYMRRSCDSPASGDGINMPDSPQRADGFYTRGMMDYAVPLTSHAHIFCGGQCGGDYFPGDLPEVDGSVVPWSS